MQMRTRTWLAAPLMLVLLSASTAWSQNKTSEKESPAALRAALEAVNAQFVTAMKAGDATAVAALYSNDAIVMAPNAPAVQGRAAIAEVFGGWMKELAITDFALKVTEVLPGGDFVTETGTYAMTMRPKAGGDAITDSGKYIVVWKRDGSSWKLHRDIWNSDVAVPAAK